MTSKVMEDVLDRFRTAVGTPDMSDLVAIDYVKAALPRVNMHLRRTYVVTSGDAIDPALPGDDNDSTFNAVLAATVLARIDPEMFQSATTEINMNLPSGHIDARGRSLAWGSVVAVWRRRLNRAVKSIVHRLPDEPFQRVSMSSSPKTSLAG